VSLTLLNLDMAFGCNRDFKQKLAERFPNDESLQSKVNENFIVNQFIKDYK